MDARTSAAAFASLFHEIFLRFHRRQAADERSLSLEALGVLEHLDGSGPLTIQECARHFERSQAATSEIVARLKRRGLLVSVTDERDRRRHLIWLSQEGLEALGRSRRVLDTELLEQAFSTQPSEEREALLSRLRAFLSEEPGPEPDSRPPKPEDPDHA